MKLQLVKILLTSFPQVGQLYNLLLMLWKTSNFPQLLHLYL